LLARIVALEQRCVLAALAVHGRADSAESVASELAGAGFLLPLSPARYRRSILGVPEEYRARLSGEERPILMSPSNSIIV
jgi:hypothetical protein